MKNCSFKGNTSAAEGGAAAADQGAEIQMLNCNLFQNDSGGGTVYNSGGHISIIHSTITDNYSSQQEGAGVLCKDGTIDLIATDHAPHSAEEKAKPLTEAPSGITGLETSLGLGITSLVKEGYLTLMELLEKMTCNPAKLYKLPGGSIQVHAPADFVIFNPDETWTVTDFASKSSNSPFKGAELYGKIHYTICNGKIVYQG